MKHQGLFRNIPQQSGMTLWGLTAVLSVLVFAAYIGMQLVPVYLTHSAVLNAVNDGLNNSNLRNVTRPAFMRSLRGQMAMDNIDDLVNWNKAISPRRERQLYSVHIKYQRLVPLFSNISLLVDFDETVERQIR